MKTIILDESQILKDAWRMYLENYSKGWTWVEVYNIIKTEAQNNAIRDMWKAEAEAKRKEEIGAEKARIEASGMDLLTYTMTSYYSTNGFKGD